MSELTVGSIAGLAANSYEVGIASGSTLDLANAKAGSLPESALAFTTGGLKLVNTVTFSGATSHWFGNASATLFPTDYKNFKIYISELAGATANTTLYLRLASDGVQATTNYEYQAFDASGTSVTGNRQQSQSSWNIGAVGYIASEPSPVDITLFNPNQALRTSIMANSGYIGSFIGTSLLQRYGVNYNSVAYDGLQLFASYNLSGRISVYGIEEA